MQANAWRATDSPGLRVFLRELTLPARLDFGALWDPVVVPCGDENRHARHGPQRGARPRGPRAADPRRAARRLQPRRPGRRGRLPRVARRARHSHHAPLRRRRRRRQRPGRPGRLRPVAVALRGGLAGRGPDAPYRLAHHRRGNAHQQHRHDRQRHAQELPRAGQHGRRHGLRRRDAGRRPAGRRRPGADRAAPRPHQLLQRAVPTGRDPRRADAQRHPVRRPDHPNAHQRRDACRQQPAGRERRERVGAAGERHVRPDRAVRRRDQLHGHHKRRRGYRAHQYGRDQSGWDRDPHRPGDPHGRRHAVRPDPPPAERPGVGLPTVAPQPERHHRAPRRGDRDARANDRSVSSRRLRKHHGEPGA